ncbi:Plant UBX domain-containing protein 10 [Abeliophyllum distichum]|uniref:Plant UBX domain-containing protein 10 n=1 Tax=Abeliophyllum distichum TaxID=126358 RepID=A0ABD1NZH1_9LAMI
MCWVHEQPAEVWSSMAALVKAEKSSAMECAGSNRGTVRMDKVETTGKPLIKESGLGWHDFMVSVTQSVSEVVDFMSNFERKHGSQLPNFVADSFMDALQRSQHAYKMLFVYLHSLEHPDGRAFCKWIFCNEASAAFVNENFVAWGGSVKASEGFKMSNSLKASRFPFCYSGLGFQKPRIHYCSRYKIYWPR